MLSERLETLKILLNICLSFVWHQYRNFPGLFPHRNHVFEHHFVYRCIPNIRRHDTRSRTLFIFGTSHFFKMLKTGRHYLCSFTLIFPRYFTPKILSLHLLKYKWLDSFIGGISRRNLSIDPFLSSALRETLRKNNNLSLCFWLWSDKPRYLCIC